MKKFITLSVLLLISAAAFSQKVSNVHFEQVGKKIHIYYDLEGRGDFSVQVLYKEGKSEIWQGPLKEISGAVGDKQTKGKNKLIVWDVLKEKEKLMGDLSFKVEGSSSQCGQLIVNYAEQVYHTVRIGNQCWMQENLNIGTRININQKMQDNSFFEKYCYDNNEINCDIYGGLYQWDEMMQYSTQESAQGICPNGWHIPSDNEWKEMEIFLGMKQRKANNTGWRGADEGETLKSTSGRNNNGYGTNSSGFNALLGGCRNITGSFSHLGRLGYWWSSTENSGSHAWYRSLGIDYSQVHRYDHYKSNGRSIRCLKN